MTEAVLRPVPARMPGDTIPSAEGRVSARTLITIRWIAVAGQLLTLMVVELLLAVSLPLLHALAAVFASVALNLYAARRLARQPFLGDRDAGLYLAYDMLQLTLLLFLTGGLENPFAVLMLAPLTVAASSLGLMPVILLTGLAVAGFTGLAVFSLPLPWPGHGVQLAPLYRLGIWASLTLSAGFIAGYLFQVAQGARRLSGALTASQMALARAQRATAVGALAAAAAHELGTPLGTIAVVAKELGRDIPPDSHLSEDVQLLQSQVARCRDILAELARRPGDTDSGSDFAPVPLPALIETVSAPYRRQEIDLRIVVANEPEDGAPRVQESPEMVHGLANILQNAMQFARTAVTVTIDWSPPGVTVTIADDGPGFPPMLLGRLGEPYLSGRSAAAREAGGNMGLGVFIAQTLLERSGAELRYANGRGGGAMVAIRWKSPMFTV
ncbi:ActS/PrrB/RegB family redox-sensitive histidine kinase [Indioceanicola profundi]|uniref:ActS/PrrB/RegB family redox-sensitive histidine kinase n=1 Tax=Indioceanicola profundi TaxID=2220096 RepID=UPI001CED6CDE|nr:ActS/PrrB/RegB family redox-sensitive histidine kinase [Indioceanicola profundi]